MNNNLTFDSIQSGFAKAQGNEPLVKETSDSAFAADVLDASRTLPIIVDLWAPWCGPCKTLGPALERAFEAAGGAVRLVKINVDENPVISSQLRVQSIPAVFAFKDGQPVDGFVGAVPESQIKDFVKRLASMSGPSQLDEIIAEAETARANNQFTVANSLYLEILKADSHNPVALGGLTHCFIEGGQFDRARETLLMAKKDQLDHPAIRSAQAALSLKESALNSTSSDITELEKKVKDDDSSLQVKYDLAIAYADSSRHQESIDQLLLIIAQDRNWNEDSAHKQLLVLFEALGSTNKITIEGRRKLSSILFS